MADREKVANRDGVYKTNRATVETGYFLADGYKFSETDEKEIGDTGRLKVLRVCPSNDQIPGPCFLSRWDEPKNTLDFDLVDRNDQVVKGKLPYGHHPKLLGPTCRFEVELGLDKDNIVFRGVVEVALGHIVRLGGRRRVVRRA